MRSNKAKAATFLRLLLFLSEARDVSINLAAAGLPTKMQRMTGAGFMPAKTGAELKLMFTYGGNSGIIKTQQTIVSATYSQIRKAF